VSRVLPYETPFISHTIGERSIIYAVFKFLRSEARHRLQQLDEFGLLPRVFSSFFDIYGGDINIIPRLSLSDHAHMFSLPTTDMVQYWYAAPLFLRHLRAGYKPLAFS